MNNGYNIFRIEAQALIAVNPDYKLKEVDQVPELNGILRLNDEQGMQIDTYEIRIICTPDYPLSFPKVFETGSRIPLNVDWHVFADGHACLCTIPEEIMACYNGLTLDIFIKDHITPYYFNQKYREMHGFFLKEREHAPSANIEYFKELFKTNDLRFIANAINYIKSNMEPGRVQDCFCGSSKKYRHCHRNAYRKLKPLPIEVVNKFISMLTAFI